MYLDICNMKSYNKSFDCEQPTLIVPNFPSPLSMSFIYLINTEHSSSGVRINDHSYSNKVL